MTTLRGISRQSDLIFQVSGQTYFHVKVGKLDNILFTQQKLEIIGALSKLGEGLSEAEKEFFENNSDKSLKQFSTVSETVVIKEGLGLTS